jgi:hypothetical protein
MITGDYRRGFGLQIEITDHFTTWLVTTLNYSAIADLHIIQITAAHAKSFQSAFTSRFQVMDLNNGDSSTAPTKSFLHRLPYDWQLLNLSLSYNISARTA